MKPEDLKMPYDWKNREPVFLNGLFTVPDFYFRHFEFIFPHFSDPLIFGNDNPVHCEVCSGNGDWVVDQAIKFPLFNWIAVERRFDRVRKIFSKKINHHLKNLFVVFGEAFTFFSQYLAKGQIKKVYIHFPDPWPKPRHAKHRLIKDNFIQEVERVLVCGGSLILVTDDISFLQQSLEVLLKFKFIPQSQPPYYDIVQENHGRESWFEILWRSKGKEIYRTVFERDGI